MIDEALHRAAPPSEEDIVPNDRRLIRSTVAAGALAAGTILAACTPAATTGSPGATDASAGQLDVDRSAPAAHGASFCGVQGAMGVPSAARDALATNPRITWSRDSQRTDVLADHVDPRLVRLLTEIAGRHTIDQLFYAGTGTTGLNAMKAPTLMGTGWNMFA